MKGTMGLYHLTASYSSHKEEIFFLLVYFELNLNVLNN